MLIVTQSDQNTQVLTMIGVEKKEYALVRVEFPACIPFNVTVANMIFSVAQLSCPVITTKHSRFHFGPLCHQGPQHIAKASAASEYVSQMFSGASNAKERFLHFSVHRGDWFCDRSRQSCYLQNEMRCRNKW